MFLDHNARVCLDGTHTEVLARYKGVSPDDACMGAAAAVRCRVGQGAAVLCGTHPELDHEWLLRESSASGCASEQNADGCGPRDEDPDMDLAGRPGPASCSSESSQAPGRLNYGCKAHYVSEEPDVSDNNVKKLREGSKMLAEILAAQEAGRKAFWLMLLHACFR